MNDALQVNGLWSGDQGGRWIKAPGESDTHTTRPLHFEFVWVRQGQSTVIIEDKPCKIGPEEIILLKPCQRIRWEYDHLESAVVYTLYFHVEAIPSHWPPMKDWPVKQKLPPNDLIRPLFEYLAGHANIVLGTGTDREVPLSLQSAVQAMLTAFVCGPIDRPQQSFPRSYPALVCRVMEWIFNFMNTDPGRQVTLGDLATVAGTDASYLCRVFRQHLGHGPMEVLYVFRITKSLVGLRAGRKLESLAQSLGFYDTSHFVKRFKAFFGKTPSQMQKALAKGYKPKLPKWPFMGG